jgi:hypothetical protein
MKISLIILISVLLTTNVQAECLGFGARFIETESFFVYPITWILEKNGAYQGGFADIAVDLHPVVLLARLPFAVVGLGPSLIAALTAPFWPCKKE